MLEPLVRLAEVRVVRPPDWEPPDDLPAWLAQRLAPTDTAPEDGEIPLIHMGNNPYHLWLVDRCRDSRAVVVTHDLVLHHLLVAASIDRGREGEYRERLSKAGGNAGAALAEGREYGLSGRLDPFLVPALEALLEPARAFVCHSRFGRDRLRAAFPGRPVLELGLPARDPGPVDRGAVRRRLGCAHDGVVAMHLGFITPEKGMEAMLAGLAGARRMGVDARLVTVGAADESGRFERLVADLGLSDHVRSIGWLPWEDMVTAPAAADVGFVLRTPSAGETSAAVVRFLACGTPAAVLGRRQFLEWPEAAAPRVTPGPSAAAEVARVLAEVGRDPAARRRAARATYEAGHRPEGAAAALAGFLTSLSPS